VTLACFRTYDIRGRLGIDLDAGIALRIGRAFARAQGARRVVVGHDARLSSPGLADAVAAGLIAEGAEVLDLGMAGTEEVYCATALQDADGGICVTASHNPADWNGMKLVGRGAAPLDPATDLAAIRAAAEADAFGRVVPGGGRTDIAAAARGAYAAHVAGFVDAAALRPLTILVDGGNGAAGPAFAAIAATLAAAGAPLVFVPRNLDPDGRFPHGIPNPLLPGNRAGTAAAVAAAGADFGVAWDGDFDRCFLFDRHGGFVDGEYVVGLLAAAFLAREPGAAIVHDPRVVWNTADVIARAGGRAVQARTGHVFIKQAMRATGAVYGGEMSAHHYFCDFFACDSGMIPWLLVAGLLGREGADLGALVAARRAAFPSSGEINFRLADPAAALARVRAALEPAADAIDETDGLSLAFPAWRFNLRASNTEPLVRLNVEARADAGGDGALVAAKAAEIAALLGG
jgi:phosphomannomutase